MISYQCICLKCNFSFSEEKSIKDGHTKTCPKCNKISVELDYSNTEPAYAYCSPGITTIGAQSDANMKRWGKELTELKIKNNSVRARQARNLERQGKEVPEHLKTEPKKDILDLSKIKDVNKYIATGDKN